MVFCFLYVVFVISVSKMVIFGLGYKYNVFFRVGFIVYAMFVDIGGLS